MLNLEYNYRSIVSTITLLIFLKQKTGKRTSLAEIEKKIKVGKNTGELRISLNQLTYAGYVVEKDGYYYLHSEYFKMLDDTFHNSRLIIK